jgi:hypothetical protein
MGMPPPPELEAPELVEVLLPAPPAPLELLAPLAPPAPLVPGPVGVVGDEHALAVTKKSAAMPPSGAFIGCRVFMCAPSGVETTIERAPRAPTAAD